MKIKELIPTNDVWHLVVIDCENTQPIFLRVACFAHVEEVDADGDLVSSLQPMVHDPENCTNGGELITGSSLDDRVLGLAEPGDHLLLGHWQSLFEERIEEENKAHERENVKHEASKIGKLTMEQLKCLMSAKGHEPLAMISPATAFEMATMGLLTVDGRPRRWMLTALGEEVLRVNST